ncbi:hypothetical protein RAS1_36610 [Phycisphaerae bacterium RAS1]|nr:hypothetical protein RAS1_36610 [Phycisphaerae bacterium RAS1]
MANAGREDRTLLTIQAGVLTWLIPGLGHFRIGQRGLAAVFFIFVSFPFWAGLAVGGIKNSINPWTNRWLFLAEMGAGGYTTAGLTWNHALSDLPPAAVGSVLNKDQAFMHASADRRKELEASLLKYVSFYPESEIAQIYLATAGLLNILAICDAMARAASGGRPTYASVLPAAETAGGRA